MRVSIQCAKKCVNTINALKNTQECINALKHFKRKKLKCAEKFCNAFKMHVLFQCMCFVVFFDVLR